MNDNDRLSPSLNALLDSERASNDAFGAEKARVRERLAATLGPGAGLAPMASTVGAATGSSVAAWSWRTLSAGLIGGSLVTFLVMRPPTSEIPRAVPTGPPPGPATTMVESTPPATAVPAVVAAAPSTEAVTPSSAAARGYSLVDATNLERTLIERARSAWAHDDADATLNALAEHRRKFPKGTLSEEREALAVQALARLGRNDEAKANAADFERKYPGSLFQDKVRGSAEATRE